MATRASRAESEPRYRNPHERNRRPAPGGPGERKGNQAQLRDDAATEASWSRDRSRATWHASRTGHTGLQKPRELINGVLVEDELIAQAMRPRLDLASGCPGKEVVKPIGGRHLIGMGVGGARACLRATGDLGFERPNRPAMFERRGGERACDGGLVRSAASCHDPW